jgi:asparagine synthase (glutamine-hydrolysing)
MCGIVGLAGQAAGAEADIRRAMDALRHRGPDASGLIAEPLVALGHRRLSIIDLCARANQPMASPSGDAVIVFNGEIYNYRELRERLEGGGERFTTTSDTEVLIRLLERQGTDGLQQLHGMFALALWRRSTQELLLARDRFGEKPLYYACSGGRILFGSELAALMEFPQLSRTLDPEALGYFLETGYVPAPLTMYAGVRSLEPGEWVRWRGGELTRGSFGAIDYRADSSLDDEPAAQDAVLGALRAAVGRQMLADVPLGAFLSGGIDSSAVVALMQQQSSRPVQTFNVRFEDAEYDESPVARAVAAHLGTDHHEMVVTDSGFQRDDLWRIVSHAGMPFADSSAIPTYVVSRHARSHVTVALSGDGGDEMFAGYPAFQWSATLRRLARWPRPALAAGAGAVRPLSRLAMGRGAGRLRQARKAFTSAQLPGEIERFRSLHWLFAPAERVELLDPAIVGRTMTRDVDLLQQLPPHATRWTPLRREMFVRLRQELPGDMLLKVDRMSMAVSLEVRAPFLDPDVARVSARLPDRHLIRDGVGKWVLREAVKPLLPPVVFDHPKWGFSIPLHRFVNDEFRDQARALLREGGPLSGIVRFPAAQTILARGLARTADAADYSVYQATHQLWALMQLGAWIERFRVGS